MAGVTNGRCLNALRALGYIADVVERRVPIPNAPPHAKRTQDFMGFADIIAFRGLPTTMSAALWATPLLVQATSGSNIAARRAKIAANEDAVWIAKTYQAYIEVWGFRRQKVKRRGPRWKRCQPCRGSGSGPGPCRAICQKCHGKGKVLRHDPTKKRAVRWVYSRERFMPDGTWMQVADGVSLPRKGATC